MSLKPVAPSDCALAIGLPLTEQDFFSDLTNDQLDYAASIKRRYQVTDVGAWRLYEKIASYAQRVCDEVEQDGVNVIRHATISTLTTLLHDHFIVTIVTHSAWPPIRENDLHHPQSLVDAIQRRRGPVPEALKAILLNGGAIGPQGSFVTTQNLARELTQWLRKVTEDAHTWFGRGVDEFTSSLEADSSVLPLRYLTRPALELAFPDEIAPGRAIELRDGLHTLPELIAAIPQAFSGILDLTICNSAILGPAIKLARPDCLVAVNRALADPDVRFVRYRVVIKSLRRHPAPFGKVLAEVHSALTERKLNL